MPGNKKTARHKQPAELSIADAAEKLRISRATAHRKWAFCSLGLPLESIAIPESGKSLSSMRQNPIGVRISLRNSRLDQYQHSMNPSFLHRLEQAFTEACELNDHGVAS